MIDTLLCRRQTYLSFTVAVLLIAGCATIEQSTAPVAVEDTGPSVLDREASQDAVRFAVIPEQSEIRVLTFRDGPMARFGHNHVITTTTMSGSVWLAENVSESIVELTLPVAGFVVDDAAARAAEGEGFDADVPDKARAGTDDNMRSERLLDAEQFPFIRIKCSELASINATTIRCAIDVKGVDHDLTLPISVEREGNRLTASGETSLSHASLGLEPFTAAGGAIGVAEIMTIKYRFTAQRLSSDR
ncbi:MAG: YceI family protein [Pseudomonadota bacterium]